jgi:hypothetical protein
MDGSLELSGWARTSKFKSPANTTSLVVLRTEKMNSMLEARLLELRQSSVVVAMTMLREPILGLTAKKRARWSTSTWSQPPVSTD